MSGSKLHWRALRACHLCEQGPFSRECIGDGTFQTSFLLGSECYCLSFSRQPGRETNVLELREALVPLKNQRAIDLSCPRGHKHGESEMGINVSEHQCQRTCALADMKSEPPLYVLLLVAILVSSMG